MKQAVTNGTSVTSSLIQKTFIPEAGGRDYDQRTFTREAGGEIMTKELYSGGWGRDYDQRTFTPEVGGEPTTKTLGPQFRGWGGRGGGGAPYEQYP